MKVKVLFFQTFDREYDVVKVFAESNYKEAERTLRIMEDYAGDDREWFLKEADLVGIEEAKDETKIQS